MSSYQETKVSLGCGTLILIAIIVAIFSNGGTKKEMRKIEERLERIERKLETLAPTTVEAPDPNAGPVPAR